MATTPIDVVLDRKAVKYTGTNSAEIAALIDDFTVTGETDTLLSFTSNGVGQSVATGGWITYWEGVARETFANDDDFRDVYRDSRDMDHVHELKLVTGPPVEAPEEY